MKKHILIIIGTAIIFTFGCIFANAESIADNSVYNGAEFDESTILAAVKINGGGVSLFSAGIQFEELGISEAENMDIDSLDEVNLFSAQDKTVNLKLTLAEPGRENVLETVEKLRELPYVECAEPNYIYTANTYPNDTYYNVQYALEKISAQSVWDMDIDCSEIVVAVIDSGVMMTHPDLKDNIWKNPGEISGNGIDDDKNGYIDDVNGWDFHAGDSDPSDERGHGTHAAGIVSASTNNGKGVASLARNAKILPLRVLGANGKGSSYAIYQAIKYVQKMGIPVVNNSYSGETESAFIVQAINECNDSLFVFAAGNDAGDNDVKPIYPASSDCSNIIAVASTDENDCLSDFSNYGANSVDIAAPGTDIASTYYNAGSAAYAKDSGTSMACPMVASAAAVMKARHPEMTPEEIIQKLMNSADRLENLNGKVISGGRLNAYEAVSVHAEKVSFSASSLVTNKYKKIDFGAEIYPANTTDAVIWSSSDTGIVSFDNGMAIAKEVGTATITMTCGNYSAECSVTVLEPEVCGVTLNTNGGKLEHADIMEYTCGIGTALPEPNKTGYAFSGWYENADFSGEPIGEITPDDAGDKVYYAKWTANQYRVILNANGGKLNNKIINYTYGVGTAVPIPEKTGYTFGGWYESADFAGEPIEKITTEDIGDKVYYAKWTANIYSVILNTNDEETGVYAITYTHGVSILLPVLEKIGYTFGGWYEKENFSGEPINSVAAEDIGDKTYYAKWTANEYNIVFNANGGDTVDSMIYIYGIGMILPESKKTGYAFGGWYESADFTGGPIAEITAEDMGDKVYYAKWTAEKYSITLNANGGEAGEKALNYTYGIGVILPEPKKTGYTFGGWYENEDFTGEPIAEITAKDMGDKVYYARWMSNKYTIRFLNDDLSEHYSGLFDFGTVPECDEPEKPSDSRYSYAFAGWKPEAAEVTGEAEYTAQFLKTPVVYFIEYDESANSAVAASPKEGECCVVFAAYKDGVLISTEMQKTVFYKAEEKTVKPLHFSADGADMVNVMLWTKSDEMRPLCSKYYMAKR